MYKYMFILYNNGISIFIHYMLSSKKSVFAFNFVLELQPCSFVYIIYEAHYCPLS